MLEGDGAVRICQVAIISLTGWLTGSDLELPPIGHGRREGRPSQR